MIGISRPMTGTRALSAVQVGVALVVRVNRDGGVGDDRLGPRRGDRDELAGVVAGGVDQRVADVPEEGIDSSSWSTSRSLRALWQPGHQLIRRLPR